MKGAIATAMGVWLTGLVLNVMAWGGLIYFTLWSAHKMGMF